METMTSELSTPSPLVIRAIIALLEKAAGPSREIDRMIYLAGSPRIPNKGKLDDWQIGAHAERFAPYYTASIDAALTLAPKNITLWEAKYKLNVGPTSTGEPETTCYARIGIVDFKSVERSAWFDGRHFTTPSIALCIAALKARKATSTAKRSPERT